MLEVADIIRLRGATYLDHHTARAAPPHDTLTLVDTPIATAVPRI